MENPPPAKPKASNQSSSTKEDEEEVKHTQKRKFDEDTRTEFKKQKTKSYDHSKTSPKTQLDISKKDLKPAKSVETKNEELPSTSKDSDTNEIDNVHKELEPEINESKVTKEENSIAYEKHSEMNEDTAKDKTEVKTQRQSGQECSERSLLSSKNIGWGM